MNINSVVKLNYIDSETGKSFKTVPKQYKSSFNKLTLVRNEYKVYCEPVEDKFDWSKVGDEDIELVGEFIKQEINKSVLQTILTNDRVSYEY